MQPRYELTDKPPPESFEKLWEQLRAFNERVVGDASAHTLAILLRESATDAIVGGLWGRSLWGSMYIDIMFVPEDLRGLGIGTSLVRQAEQEALRRGCKHMWTDTYAFQARQFYEKMDFIVFGHLDGPAPIFPRFFLMKEVVRRPKTEP
jgi:GNAT superfamily N-acetyltransferase